ncbi:hypothetical protein NXY56_005942 [Leishmania guyanensis]
MVISLACHLAAAHHNCGYSGGRVTRWDTLGCVAAGLGAALMMLGGVRQGTVHYCGSLGIAFLSLLSQGLSVAISEVWWRCFMRPLWDMNQQFLLSTLLGVRTLVLGI